MNILWRFYQMFSVPTFADEDTTRTARLIHFILIILILAVAAFSLGMIFLAPERMHRLPIVLFFLLMLLVQLSLLPRLGVRITSIMLTGLLWVGVTGANVTGGGIHHPGYGAYVVIVGIAALLLGVRWGMGFAALSTGAGLVMVIGENTGFIDGDTLAFTPISIWLIQTVYFVVTAILIHYAAQNIYQALKRVRANESLLKERNEQLEQEIARREVAERRNLELALERERFEVFRQLIDELSHDLKTPLTIIGTSLYLLQQIDDPQQQKAKIEVIQAQTERLRSYVQDILMLSRLDNVPVVDLTPTDVNQLIHELERQFRPTCEQKSLQLDVELNAVQPYVRSNSDELHRAILNLMENAAQYTLADGAITVSTYNHEDLLVIEVSDTGIGIAEDDLPHIFNRFYRTNTARTTEKTGSGLGLAIVKKIIDIHNGEVQVKSREGEGTTFQIRLPVTDPL